MYQRCSMQYYFRYVKGLKERPKLALSQGKAGHDALEANYRQKVRRGTDMPLENLLDKYSDFFDNETQELTDQDLEPDEDLGKAKDAGILTMRNFHKNTAPKIRPALVEFEFNMDLTDPVYEYPLRIANGRIDLVTASEEIFDSKFLMARRPKSQADVDLSQQLSLYDLVYKERFNRLPRAVGFMAFLPPGKKADTPPEVQIIKRSPELMKPGIREARHARTIHQLHTVEQEIAAGIFRPVDDPRTCSWCGYREMCQFSLVKDDFTAMKIRQAEDPT